MAFPHMMVSRVIADTDKWRNTTQNDTGYAGGVGTHLDGVALPNRMVEFLLALRKAIPNLRFGVRESSEMVYVHAAGREHGAYLPKVAWVYVDGDVLCPMMIETRSDYFYIHARTIANNRHSAIHDDYYSVRSESVTKICTKAKKYFRRYGPKEVAHVLSEQVYRYLSYTAYDIARNENAARGALQGDSSVIDELVSLHNSGYKFTDPTLHQRIEEYTKARNAHKEVKNRSVSGKLVSISTHSGKQLVMVVDAHDLQAGTPTFGEVTRYEEGDVPDYIAAAVATLSIVDHNKPVEGLGQRVSDYVYWVF